MSKMPQAVLDYAVTMAESLKPMQKAGIWASDERVIADYEPMKGFVLKVTVMTEEQYLAEEMGEDGDD